MSLAAEWVIINYDILGRHLDDLLRVPWAAIVFDEAHYLKNHTSARSKLSPVDGNRCPRLRLRSPCSC